MNEAAEHDDEDRETPVTVPWRELSETALNGVIEAFVLREGTEYGAQDYALEDKVAQVRRQLERGEAEVRYDAKSGSVTIAPSETASGRAGSRHTPRSAGQS